MTPLDAVPWVALFLSGILIPILGGIVKRQNRVSERVSACECESARQSERIVALQKTADKIERGVERLLESTYPRARQESTHGKE